MKKQLDYFHVDGEFGGNQDHFTNVVMKIGGCAAATACDSSIYLALYKDMKDLYPLELSDQLTTKDYLAFSQIMKPYIKPRLSGVKKVAWYIDGFQRYISDRNRQTGSALQLNMKDFSGERCYADARQAVKQQINKGLPVPFLMLHHQNPRFADFNWHWFLLVGYDERPDGMYVTAATYGHAVDLSFQEFWATGYKEKGGMVIYSL